MPRCRGLTRAGDRCTAIVAMGSAYCYQHDPARAQERKRNASKAARSKKPGTRVRDLDAQLEKLYQDTLNGTTERATAAVLVQIVSARTRLLETERRIQETEAYEDRISELEAIVNEQRRTGGRRTW